MIEKELAGMGENDNMKQAKQVAAPYLAYMVTG